MGFEPTRVASLPPEGSVSAVSPRPQMHDYYNFFYKECKASFINEQ